MGEWAVLDEMLCKCADDIRIEVDVDPFGRETVRIYDDGVGQCCDAVGWEVAERPLDRAVAADIFRTTRRWSR